MNLKSLPLLLLPAAIMMILAGCRGDTEPKPDIEATVEAKVELALAIEAAVEARVQQARAALPTPAPTPLPSVVTPKPAPSPVPTPTPCCDNAVPTPAPNLTPTPSIIPTPSPTPFLSPTPTKVSPTRPSAETSSEVPTPTVTKPESQSRDRLFVRPGGQTGVYSCTQDTTRAFTSSIVPTNLLTDIEPMGKMAASHVTPTDHLYVHWAPPVRGITDYVVAPADGQIVEISRFPSDKVVRYDNSIIVPDYRMVLMHSCAFFTIFIHLAELAPTIAEQTGPIPLGGHWFSTHSGPIEVRAGDPLSKISGTGLDWSVHDADVTLPGFIVPEHYAGEPWKIHTVDPFQYYEEPLRSELLSKVVRTVEPRAGKIDYDVERTILGNWFLKGTVDYSGNTDDPEYWKGHLAIAYGWIDPSQVRISIGFETGIDDNQLCNVCFSAYGVRGNQPDPVTIGMTAGLVKYELMSRRGPNHEQIGRTALGTFLVQHLGNRTIRVELITHKSPQEVTGFSDAARIYHR